MIRVLEFRTRLWLSLKPPWWIAQASLARPLKMLQDFAPQRRLLIGAPATEPLAGLEAKLSARHQCFEIRRRTRPLINIGQHRLVDCEGQIGADEIGVLERAQ